MVDPAPPALQPFTSMCGTSVKVWAIQSMTASVLACPLWWNSTGAPTPCGSS